MAENPVKTLARLLAGVGLMHGRLGHQVLGQMLIMGNVSAAVAGAAVVVAATSRQKNAVAQVALRTAAPAIAATVLTQQRSNRVDRREVQLEEKERAMTKRAEAIKNDEARMAAIEQENRDLLQQLEQLRAALAAPQIAVPQEAAPQEDAPQKAAAPALPPPARRAAKRKSKKRAPRRR